MKKRGVSQRDIKLATNAVDNRANSQADASDSSMTGMIFQAPLPAQFSITLLICLLVDALDYSNSESSFSAFSGDSGEVVRRPYSFLRCCAD